MPRRTPTPAPLPRPILRRSRWGAGWLAVLFVWLGVLAPALHQHNRPANIAGGRVSSASSVTAAEKNRAVLSSDTVAFNADDFCVLCDFLTTATFAPPPTAPVCTVAGVGVVRGPPVLVSPSSPLLRRALFRFSPRGPPTRA